MPLLNMRLHGLFTGENLGKMLVKLPARMAVS
jgi:NADPH-dependent curcumin reductase CurA